MSQPDNQIMQIAYVVDDLDRALEHWTKSMGIGPFFVMEGLEIVDPRYRGQPTDIDITIALGYSGSMCVELIRQNDDGPSVYRELLDRTGCGGFHHWGIGTEQFDEEVARYQSRGYDEVFTGKVAVGDRYAYMDTQEDLGGMIELIKLTPVVRELFGNLEAAATDWDGSDPVRRPE
ncbi:MAG: VOC family protein [Gammaproteobacteria bacterium]|nr:VOC family protein [Gammaproteobacteria bacterium]